MQKNFVKHNGGKIPTEEDLKNPVPAAERLKKESTYELTKELLQSGLDLESIAKARNLTTSTIANHLEILTENKDITTEDLKSVIKNEDWQKTKSELFTIFDKVGTEKLKPVFEAGNEKYDYHTIRLARIFYNLSNDPSDERPF